MVALAAFLFAADKQLSLSLMFFAIFGLGLVIASGCVFNNYLDINLDKKMERTKKRASVTGDIALRAGLTYGSLLFIGGLITLSTQVNLVSSFVAVVGFTMYVGVYGYAKRHTVFSTEIGSVSGATPPVVGYTAVTGRIDLTAIVLFVTLVVWQMPHFFSIGIFRKKEYKKANLPVRSVSKGIASSVTLIKAYVWIFLFAAASLFYIDKAGLVYLIGMFIVSIYWIYYSYKKQQNINVERWAKGMFGISLVVLLTYSLLLAINPWLP